MRRAALLISLTALLGACFFTYRNPAEKLKYGEIRGRSTKQKEGSTTAFDPLAGAQIGLRVAPFSFQTKATGYFAIHDMPQGTHSVVIESNVGGVHRSTLKKVTLGFQSDGQVEGLDLRDVALLHTAAVKGTVMNAGQPVSGATVVDDVSLLAAVTDASGVFTFPSLGVGEHKLRASSGALIGGVLDAAVADADQKSTKTLATALSVAAPSGQGHIELSLTALAPKRPSFLSEMKVELVPAQSGPPARGPYVPPQNITLSNTTGNFSQDVPEGVYTLSIQPPDGNAEAGEFVAPNVMNIIILKDHPVNLGSVYLVRPQSVKTAALACESNADCGAGIACKSRQCAVEAIEKSPGFCLDIHCSAAQLANQSSATPPLGSPCNWASTNVLVSTLHDGPDFPEQIAIVPGTPYIAVADSSTALRLVHRIDTRGPSLGDSYTTPMNGPAGITHDGAGAFYIADNGQIFTMAEHRTLTTAIMPVALANAANINHIAFYNPGSAQPALLYYTTLNNVFRKATDASPGTSVASFGGNGIALFPPPNTKPKFAIADPVKHQIYVFTDDGSGSPPIGYGKLNTPGFIDGATGTGTFNTPHAVAVDKYGEIFVADTVNESIRHIDANGNTKTIAGNGVLGGAPPAGAPPVSGKAAQFSSPFGIAVDSDKCTLYVSDSGNGTVRMIVAQ